MSTLVQSLGDFFKLLVQAFNLSSTFPSVVLVSLLYLFVLPKLSPTSPLRFDLIDDTFIKGGFLVTVIALLSYLLDAANFRLVRFFEGYWFRDQFPFDFFEKRNREHVSETVDKLRKIEKTVDDLLAQAKQDDQQWEVLLDLAGKLADHSVQLDRQIAYKYPEEPEFVLSSPLGNIIAAAERYPKKVFCMESVVLWPFLSQILTKEGFSQFVLREKAIMDFLLNLTTVLAGFGMLYGVTKCWTESWSTKMVIQLAGHLGLIVAMCCLTFWLSLQAAANWGATIRTAFVLYREDLRQNLRLCRVFSYAEERKLWEQASSFFQARQSLATQLALGHRIFDRSSYKAVYPRKEDRS